jgi:hypothetical protein
MTAYLARFGQKWTAVDLSALLRKEHAQSSVKT